MEITKENLHKAIAALRQCAKENKGKQTDTGYIVVSDLCLDVADYLEKPAASVWHDISEKPKMNSIIVMNNDQTTLSVEYAGQSLCGVERWVYIDDLLKL